jgi:hypothetical protein
VRHITSIALDSNDYPHISYYTLPDADLKYAHWTGTQWQTEIVDSQGDEGLFNSIALDSNNYPHISYCYFIDLQYAAQKYARWTGSDWEIETVDSGAPVGWFGSLALDSHEYAHISYCDGGNGNLKYAHWTGSAWEIQTVDSTGDVRRRTSIAVDAYDYPHVAYYDSADKDLRYATWSGSGWRIEIVDSAGDVGDDPSLALNTSGYPYPQIAYFDRTNGDLKYASGRRVTSGYTFDTGVEGWEFTGEVIPFESAVSASGSGHIGMSPQGSAYCFAFWDSPLIEVEAGKEYRAEFRVSSSVTDPDTSLEFRLRANQQSNGRYWTTGVMSLGGVAPYAGSPKSYELVVVPQTNTTDTLRLSFDLIGFRPEDDIYSWIYLEDVTLQEFISRGTQGSIELYE